MNNANMLLSSLMYDREGGAQKYLEMQAKKTGWQK
jgi:hypothetical protein